ncbi:hypothetical protein L1049_004336 [Liquidambar formosana]|uniref:Homeobox domain-containing protein n=1 Tax=Liquidambar formosana TaxID=63359 RepID=A0AAP0RSQ2_LIQFO
MVSTMEVLKENLSELEMGSTAESFQKFLDSQRELFHSQIDQLQNIVVTQCKLTGVNPLSQEMAAGALSIKIGKRPRDLLNPKAVKYMQSVFSIKDAISKKESREISALFGVTVTQVRDFFTSQRSRVRKLVRLSREKSIRSKACKEPHDGVPSSSDPLIPIDPVPLNTVGPASVEEAPSCLTQNEALPGIDDSDKQFVENIFSLMRKEETFSGQVKLMEWILRIQNSSVLYWFLTKGGVMILATWLSQAAIEEQTSVLFVVLKVLCHLPLHKALPVHMSAILQSVNRLRFYRTSDISNRARVLLSRWSKIFARSQAMKKPNGMKSSSDAQKDILLKQSISEVMGDESWQSKIDIPGEIFAPSYESSENFRKLEPPQALKLLPASTDDSSRKHIRGVSSSQTRERRKVLLVEQPGQKMAGRSLQVARTVSAIQGRPMSADDIQKAKMRAQFMQSKYGKTSTSSNESHEVKTEGLNKPLTNEASVLLPASKVLVRPKIEEHKKPVILPSNISSRPEASFYPKPSLDLKEPLWEKCKRVQIPWQTPPEIRINSVWRIGDEANSKEVEVQKNRIRREKETVYRTVQEIPHNPKEPWDIEMDYDDTLTPEIPTEQPPDADNAEKQVSPRECENRAAVTSAATTSQIGGGAAPEPDLELLAVLLKNPELVFALTSGQGGNLSSEETVRLLDMIKTNGVGLLGNLNGVGGKAERVEVSLPSPTPSSDPGTGGWRPEVAKNPFSRQSSMAYASPGVAVSTPTLEKLPPTSLVQQQFSTANRTIRQQPTSIPSLSHQFPGAMSTFSMPQTTTVISERRLPSVIPSIHQNDPTNPILHSPTPETVFSMKNLPHTSMPTPNLSAAAAPAARVESTSNVKPAPVSIVVNTPDRTAISFPLHPLLPTPAQQQTQPQQPSLIPELTPQLTPPYPTRPTVNPGPTPDPWRARQGLASNPCFQANQNNYNASIGGAVQPLMLSGPPWERNEYVGGEEFETWSPEGSPSRSPEYNISGWNISETRMNFDRNYRPDRSRPRNSSGYRDHNNNRHGNRRWRGRDRDRDRDRRR